MNTNQAITDLAAAYGFQTYFVFLPKYYPEPFALLLYAYKPFSEDTYIPAYYVASNKSYHSYKTLIANLNTEGMNAQPISILLKQAAQDAGLGLIGRNTLLHTNDSGSRLVLYALSATGIQPISYQIPTNDFCATCKACINACPTKAITEDGFIRERCMREQMETPPYSRKVEQHIRTYLGCEICMQVCPYNNGIKTITPDVTLIELLEPHKILEGDVKCAKEIFGKNIKAKRIMADAQALIKNGRCKDAR